MIWTHNVYQANNLNQKTKLNSPYTYTVTHTTLKRREPTELNLRIT